VSIHAECIFTCIHVFGLTAFYLCFAFFRVRMLEQRDLLLQCVDTKSSRGPTSFSSVHRTSADHSYSHMMANGGAGGSENGSILSSFTDRDGVVKYPPASGDSWPHNSDATGAISNLASSHSHRFDPSAMSAISTNAHSIGSTTSSATSSHSSSSNSTSSGSSSHNSSGSANVEGGFLDHEEPRNKTSLAAPTPRTTYAYHYNHMNTPSGTTTTNSTPYSSAYGPSSSSSSSSDRRAVNQPQTPRSSSNSSTANTSTTSRSPATTRSPISTGQSSYYGFIRLAASNPYNIDAHQSNVRGHGEGDSEVHKAGSRAVHSAMKNSSVNSGNSSSNNSSSATSASTTSSGANSKTVTFLQDSDDEEPCKPWSRCADICAYVWHMRLLIYMHIYTCIHIDTFL
jgi:hypothetical protein